jgi:RNAse (barnase) inhibitor barstar
MQEILLSGADCLTPDEFYAALLRSLGAPSWHGHNLDALWDSITGGGLNQVNPPFRITLTGVTEMPPTCKVLVDRLVMLISDARDQGLAVEIVCR